MCTGEVVRLALFHTHRETSPKLSKNLGVFIALSPGASSNGSFHSPCLHTRRGMSRMGHNFSLFDSLANLAINELAFQTSEQEACKCLAYFLGQ